MAKNGTPPESDWLQVPITVVKENYASFDRCMKDAIRFDRGGGRSISASETEERGAGRRISRVRKRSPSIESDSTEEYPEPPRKKTPRTSPRYKKNLSFSSTETSHPVINYPATSEIRQPSPSGNAKVTQVRVLCEISKKKHFCSLQNPVTLESLARGLCELSKSVHGLQSKVRDLRQEIMSKRSEASSVPDIQGDSYR
ncbi:uncharacterized protein LOC116180064 [Photinus pyralis]|uniref:uncharacterized protein LOC116180064 n=1 Tax=Photinus pyralis TaxID=7054 RepID=UPI0012676CDA|nr:uncharacterized protein LOC116180064 [Photinus pyralis]